MVLHQAPAPVDHGAQRAVARQRGAAAAGEQPEAVVEARGELLDRHRAQPRGGELDRQRQPVEAAADLARRRRRRARSRGAAAARSLNRRTRGVVGSSGGIGDEALARDRQRLAAGGDDPQPGAAGQQLVGELGDGARSGARSCRAAGSSRARRARRAGGRGRRAGVAPRARARRRRAARARRAWPGTISTSAVTGASSTIQTPSCDAVHPAASAPRRRAASCPRRRGRRA